jgi:tetratricopeptide (TPR) repeat protein
VEKDNFLDVLRHYSESTEEEALRVLSLRESYPYSQLLHALSARVSKDHDFSNHSKELQLAAVYAADRSVLKDVMTLDNLLATRAISSAVKQDVTVAASAPKVVEQAPVAAISDDNDSLADQVLNDLEKLHTLRHNFEQMFLDTVPPRTGSPITVNEQANEAPQKDSSKTRKARIVELAKAMAAAKEGEPMEEAPKPKKKKDLSTENLIDELATTKKEIEPENEKQKEQLEIIEQFIKTQPSISSPKDKPIVTPPGDLSSIKTGEFNDNVVSETLVEILLKQGKKDKAVEVLKKLIWKFPQKKAYFAAQIEELKSS